MDNFFITLLSNSSISVFENNTLSSFTNILNIPIKLDGTWVVGISAIYLNKLKISVRKRDVSNNLNSTESHKKLKEFSKSIEDKKEDRGKVNNNNNNLLQLPHLPEYMSTLLNPLNLLKNSIDDHSEIIKQNVFQSTNIVTHGFIYSDIIQPRLVGDQNIKCLKILQKSNLQQSLEFSTIEYYPLQSNYITDISILITNDNGDKMNFENSKIPTMCTLHFKKIN